MTTFKLNANEFINLVKHLTVKELSQEFVKKEYGNYLRNIDVMIEYCYYHLGQLVIIKKMIQNTDNSI